MPLGASAELWNGHVTLVMPYSAMPDDLTEKYSTNFHVRAENHKKAYGEIIKYLSGRSLKMKPEEMCMMKRSLRKQKKCLY